MYIVCWLAHISDKGKYLAAPSRNKNAPPPSPPLTTLSYPRDKKSQKTKMTPQPQTSPETNCASTPRDFVLIQTRSLRGRKLFNCDLQKWHSVFTPVRVLYRVCPFVALLKATFSENSHFVLSCRYIKAVIVNLLCLLICVRPRKILLGGATLEKISLDNPIMLTMIDTVCRARVASQFSGETSSS